MKNLIRKNWFWVGLVGLMLLLMQFTHFSPLYSVDHAVFDTGMQSLHKGLGRADDIVVLTLQKTDLETDSSQLNLKEALIRLLKALENSGAKSIAIFAPLADIQAETGVSALAAAQAYVTEVELAQKQKTELQDMLARVQEQLDVDGRLFKQISHLKNVYLPFDLSPEAESVFSYGFDLSATMKNKNSPDNVLQALEESPKQLAVVGSRPMADLSTRAAGLGYMSQLLDTDEVVRSVQFVQPYQQQWLASLPLMLAAKMLGTPMDEITFMPGDSVKIGGRLVRIDSQNRMYPNFYSGVEEGHSPYAYYSYADVVSGKVARQHLRNKLLLIDASEFLPVQPVATPIATTTSAVEMAAQTVASILNQDIYQRPQALQWLELALFIAVGLYLMLLLPRLGLTSGFFITLLILVALLGSEFYLLLSKQSWLHTGASVMFLCLGYLVIAAQYIFHMQRIKHEQDLYFTNRQLGLLLQEQGRLEQAFDCFQKLPSNIDNLDLVYNLALDFERKRKFNNAVAAFNYIMHQQADFRDTEKRVERARQMEHSMTMGTGQFNTLGSLLDENRGEKPMLGRFVIERELGKGAMGAVYLGRDPKIDRVVAVKTLALSQEFGSDEIKEVEARFFHEASAAGRLNHPNIVTIYDAAEDHDLAYIAMEFIEGKPLSDFAKKDSLLPVQTVLSIIAKTADALEYAGKQGIVHRDIKPANIMYNQDGNVVKITDFGIARIASSGRTKTGMILGTPSYMSPEQMSGQHVDSRSDIFSLGVTMFVLLTGEKAFPGDSLAAISYKIVNDKHPDITAIRKDIPVSIKKVIDKALQKDPDKRYQSGIVMKRAIIRCLKELTGE